MSIVLTKNFKAVHRKDPKSVAIHILLDLCTYVQVMAGFHRKPVSVTLSLMKHLSINI